MGRQINFYMDSVDEKKFADFLTKEENMFFYLNRQKNIIPDSLKKLPSEEVKFSFSIVLWSKDFFNPFLRKIEGKEEYSFDKTKSEVFEFSRCVVKDNKVIRGRIWYETSYYDEKGELIKKPEYMDKVYNQIVRWIKKNSKKIGTNYYFPSAIELKEKGYIFTQ